MYWCSVYHQIPIIFILLEGLMIIASPSRNKWSFISSNIYTYPMFYCCISRVLVRIFVPSPFLFMHLPFQPHVFPTLSTLPGVLLDVWEGLCFALHFSPLYICIGWCCPNVGLSKTSVPLSHQTLAQCDVRYIWIATRRLHLSSRMLIGW